MLFYQYTLQPPEDFQSCIAVVRYVSLLLCSESLAYSYTYPFILRNKGKIGLLFCLKAVAVYPFHYSKGGFAEYWQLYIVISVPASQIIVAFCFFAIVCL